MSASVWRLHELRTTRNTVPEIVLVAPSGQKKVAPLSRAELARLVADGAQAMERLAHVDECARIRAEAEQEWSARVERATP